MSNQLTFEQLVELEQIKGNYQMKLTLSVGILVMIVIFTCLYYTRKGLKGFKQDMGEIMGEALSDIKSVTGSIKKEVNKSVWDRLGEFYDTTCKTPEAVLVIGAGCGFLFREVVIRKCRNNGKESLSALKSSHLLKICDGVLALMIMPALFTHGIKFAVTAWKSAVTFIQSLKSIIMGFNLVKSYYGSEVEFTVTDPDFADDVEAAIDAVTARVEETVKEALKAAMYKKHDTKNDLFDNYHVCSSKCNWVDTEHLPGCGITKEHILDSQRFYTCMCPSGAMNFTVPQNATAKPAHSFLINGKMHKNCDYSKRCAQIANIISAEIETPKYLPFPKCQDTCCSIVYKMDTVMVSNSATTKSSKILQDVLQNTRKNAFDQHEMATPVSNTPKRSGKDEEFPYVPEVFDDVKTVNSELMKVNDFIASHGSKKKSPLENMMKFLKYNSKYALMVGMALMVTIFLILLYTSNKRKYVKISDVKEMTMQDPGTGKKEAEISKEKQSNEDEVKEGKAANAKRKAQRAAKQNAPKPKAPWWLQSSSDDDQDDVSDYGVNWTSKADLRQELLDEISRTEDQLIASENLLMEEIIKGYDKESVGIDLVPTQTMVDTLRSKFDYLWNFGAEGLGLKTYYVNKETHNKESLLIAVKEANQEFVNNACKQGTKCKFGKKCKYRHDLSYGKILTKKIKEPTAKSFDKVYRNADVNKSKKKVQHNIVKAAPVKAATIKSNVPLAKEARHNGNSVIVTPVMRALVGWVESDNGDSHNATKMWNGFISSKHIFADSGSSLKASFRINGVVETGTWMRNEATYICDDTYYFQWCKCTNNENMRKHSGSVLSGSLPKLDAKVILLAYPSEVDFLADKMAEDISTIVSVEERRDEQKISYLRCATKNTSDFGYCAAPYIVGNSVVGWHNERGDHLNYFIGVTKECTVRATGSALN